MSNTIYKVVPRNLWTKAETIGVFTGSAVDVADGFIHFSTRQQLAGTVAKHFASQKDIRRTLRTRVSFSFNGGFSAHSRNDGLMATMGLMAQASADLRRTVTRDVPPLRTSLRVGIHYAMVD